MPNNEMDSNTGRRVEFNIQIHKLTFNPTVAIDEDPGQEIVEDLVEEGSQRSLSSPTLTKTAWYVLAASCIISFFAIGPLYSYYIVLTRLTGPASLPQYPKASLSLVSSLTNGITAAGFPFAGWLVDRVGYRCITVSGLLLISIGLVLSSLAFAFWQILLTQGIMVGCGTCLVFYTVSTIAIPWFRHRRFLPVAANAVAIGLGGMFYALIFGALDHSQSYFRGNAAILLFPSIAATPFLKKRMPTLNRERVLDFSRLRELKMLGLLLSCFFVSLSFLAPFYVIPILSQDYKFNFTELVGLNACICGGLAMGGATLPFLSAYIGVLNTLMSSLFLGSIMGLTVWLFNTDFPALTAFCILHGILSGSMLTLLPLASFLFGVPSATQTLGMLYLSNGVASVIGPPTISALVEISPFGKVWPYPFLPAILFTSLTTLASGALMLWTRRRFNLSRR